MIWRDMLDEVEGQVPDMDYPSPFPSRRGQAAELLTATHGPAAAKSAAAEKLSGMLRRFSPLPRGVLFFGAASDGLPVLLDLNDSVPGAVLVAADPGAGKTRLLQTIARAVDHTHDAGVIRYAVISERPQEWDRFETSPNCEGVWSFDHPSTANYAAGLVQDAEGDGDRQDFSILFLDGLQALTRDHGAQESLRWLLQRGSARRVRALVTVNASVAAELVAWTGLFHTVVCGHMEIRPHMEILTGSREEVFSRLSAGSQFAVREGEGWLPFRLPDLD